MNCQIDCIHCYLKQAVSAMKLIDVPESKQQQILFELMDDIKTYDTTKSPAENSSIALIKTYEMINNDDPYEQVKKEANDMVMTLLPRLENIINDSEDKLYTAIKLAVAGNIIDLGIQRSFDIDDAIEQCLNIGFTKDDYKQFLEKLNNTDKIMIVGDNTGEIVFDILLVEQLKKMGKEVSYMVKSGPVINDSTIKDAVYVGMDKIANVFESGCRVVGTPVSLLSEYAYNEMKNTTLIISKGQGNFETLEDEDISKDRIFFLLRIKCHDVAVFASKMANKNIDYQDIVFMQC